MSAPERWHGQPPKECDLCKLPVTLTFIDGATRSGPWANMCPECHKRYGRGLGVGRGQKYLFQNGHFEKVEG